MPTDDDDELAGDESTTDAAAGDGLIEVVDGDVRWRFEPTFLRSNWTCIWGRGCQGILDVPAPELQQGCCSVGAELGDPEEAMTIAALAATLAPELWQHHAAARLPGGDGGLSADHGDAAAGDGVFSDSSRTNTRVVDGACIFLNRPGFAGGAGCALHLAALEVDESPLDWKPSVCWQLPIRVDWAPHPDGTETATVRRWSRADWGPEGTTMAWCCTEEPSAYVGDRPVIESLAEELAGIVGETVMVELRRKL